MKIDRSGRPDIAARLSPSASQAPPRRNRPLRRIAIAAAVLVAVALSAFVARHAILGTLLSRGVGIATGDRLSFGTFQVGPTGSVFTDLKVTTHDGDALLDARRLVVRYSLTDLIVNRTRRFGISALTVDGFIFSLVRRADGSYNIESGGGGGAAAGAAPGNAPWDLRVSLSDGEIRLIDGAPVAPDLAQQRIVNVTFSARIRSDRRSVGSGRAQLLGRRTEA